MDFLIIDMILCDMTYVDMILCDMTYVDMILCDMTYVMEKNMNMLWYTLKVESR